MKNLTILAGPNGAGKSTCTEYFLKQNILPSAPVNLDDLKKLIDPSQLPDDILRFQREEDKKLDELFRELYMKKIASEVDFSYECNLREDQLKPIPYFEKAGYSINLIYLSLNDIKQSENRVAERVLQGGHNISKSSIKENFEEGLKVLDLTFQDWNSVLIIDNSSDMLSSIFMKDKKLVYKFNLPDCINRKSTPKLYKFLK